MPLFRKKPQVVSAEQWQPGKEVAGVVGANPKKLCGCVVIGGPSNQPHCHSLQGVVSVDPGDWVIEFEGAGFKVVGDEQIQEGYDQVPEKCPACKTGEPVPTHFGFLCMTCITHP